MKAIVLIPTTMSEASRRAILALGVSRLINLNQKERQRTRARKVASYLKMTKALKSDLFRRRLRIDSGSLFKLLGLIRPYIENMKIDLEEASVEERLLVTLKYLASGQSVEQLSNDSVKPRSLERIIPETCRAINKCLREYILFPKTAADWEDIASAFEKKWNFSHCAGALAAKHIAIVEPEDEPNKYLNHKQFHSIVLVAVVNANHEFTYISAGLDGGYQYIYVSTEFFEMLTEDSIHLPSDCRLEGTEHLMPYVFLGETDFLIENIMKPYPSDQLSQERKMFNYRFSRAKRVADNAFGILYERFGVFQQKITIKEEHLNSVVMACCVLHNFLMRNCKEYINEESFDREDVNNFSFSPAAWRLKKEDGIEWADTHPLLSLEQKDETLPDSRGEMVRDGFTRYFCNEGKVPFQDEMVNVVSDL